MDNVTHSLAGLLLAEAAVQLRARGTGAEASSAFRAVAVPASIVAANLPDADLVYTGVGGDRLAYMLHHRGHTHTVVLAIVGALLVWAIAAAAWRWRARAAPARADAWWLLALLLAGTLSHVALDWTNSYGVHPFWPFDDRWRYGDAVFIVEPWLWVVSIPALVAASATRPARWLLSLVLLAGLALAWRVDMVTAPAAAALTVGAALSVAAARVLRPGARVAAATGAWLVVTLVMAAGAAAARAAVLRATHDADPAAQVLDVVVSPLPANPVCILAMTVERSGSVYRVASARASALPSLADAGRCGRRDTGPTFGRSARRSTRAVHWDGEWSAPSAELATLARESCPALAALRFIRAPVWRGVDDSTLVVGDARYGGTSDRGFTSVRVPRRSAKCPANVPPWVPPRADVLGARLLDDAGPA